MSTTGVSNVGGVASAAMGGTPWGLIGLGGGALLGGIGSLLKKKPKLPNYSDLSRMFGAGALGQDWQQLYQTMRGGAGFQQALSQNALAGARAGGDIQANLMRHGISGASLIGSSLGGNLAALGEGALSGGLFNTAGSIAQQNLLARLQAQQSYDQMRMQQYNQPNFLQQLGSAGLTAGSLSLLK